MASHADLTRSNAGVTSSIGGNGRLNSLAYRAARRGVRFGPRPPTMRGTPPDLGSRCVGFGSAGESRIG